MATTGSFEARVIGSIRTACDGCEAPGRPEACHGCLVRIVETPSSVAVAHVRLSIVVQRPGEKDESVAVEFKDLPNMMRAVLQGVSAAIVERK
jgi:hypothetical protein